MKTKQEAEEEREFKERGWQQHGEREAVFNPFFFFLSTELVCDVVIWTEGCLKSVAFSSLDLSHLFFFHVCLIL